MSIELIVIVLTVLVLATVAARVVVVARRSGGRSALSRQENESTGRWALRTLTGRLNQQPEEPEPAPGDVNPLDRLALLMGDGGPGEEPVHERVDLAPPPPAQVVPPPYVPPVHVTPTHVTPTHVPRARVEEPVPLLLQQRPRPVVAAAAPMATAANPTVSGDLSARTGGWIADLVASTEATPFEAPASRRRRLYRDAAAVLLVACLVALAAFAIGPKLFGGTAGPGATENPSQIAVATESPSASVVIVAPSATPTPSATETPSASPSPTPSVTPAPTSKPTPKPTPRPTPRPTPAPTPTPPPAPNANVFVSYDVTACGPTTTLIFDGSASTHATSYSWSFGQGSGSTKKSGSHNYTLALTTGKTKSFNVKLTVSNASGNNSETKKITFSCP